MKNGKSIQLKAAFLVIVFSLNTIIGFACAVGMDMGFNSKHHDDDEMREVVIHIHKDGTKHVHQERPNPVKSHHSNKKIAKAVVHFHSDGKKHVHQEKSGKQNLDKTSSHDEKINIKPISGKDNCCNDKVMQFEQLDKSVAQTFSYISPVFYTAFLSTYFYDDVFYFFEGSPAIKYFVRSHHPPIPDIRLAIRSFQI
jgi:hypothetical protein